MKYVVSKDEALYHEAKSPRRYRRLWIDKERGARNFSGGSCEIPSGSENPYHAHDSEEIMFIYRGTGIAVFNGEEYPIEPETMVFVPPGVQHQFKNSGSDDLCFVYFYVPAGPEHGFRDLVAQERE